MKQSSPTPSLQCSPARAGMTRIKTCFWLAYIMMLVQETTAIHHMKRAPLAWVSPRDSSVPLVVSNLCTETIYPGILTQSGTGPTSGGFKLNTGDTKNLTVGSDWQGRVWGRTNCSFNPQGTGPSNTGGNNGNGQACDSGDCNGMVNCKVTGNTPVTLAEFTLASSSGQCFYDLSMVDGYNLPMAIVSLYPQSSNPKLANIPPNLMNPICIGTSSFLEGQSSTSDAHSGTNGSFPIPLETSVTQSFIQSWCPWDLQVSPPTKPGDGVYPYPDDNIQRPIFDPCFSACAKYNHPADCCTGSYDSSKSCKPSLYSQSAKKICPDAYSYAYDDQTSTFILPSGGGFEIVFCPKGRSSNILKVLGNQLRAVAAQGGVSQQIIQQLANGSYPAQSSATRLSISDGSLSFISVLMAVVVGVWEFI